MAVASRAEWVEPVQVKLKNNLTLYSHPPPGSGVVTAYIMRLLDGHLGSDGMDGDNPVTYHRIAEAIKHAFGQRTKLSDPRFHPEVNKVRPASSAFHKFRLFLFVFLCLVFICGRIVGGIVDFRLVC